MVKTFLGKLLLSGSVQKLTPTCLHGGDRPHEDADVRNEQGLQTTAAFQDCS